ncbi:MAG: hypothetical protein KBB39_16740 [Phycicoccus sp.]|nr:hypothetical protein [Phycicoccus sp.]
MTGQIVVDWVISDAAPPGNPTRSRRRGGACEQRGAVPSAIAALTETCPDIGAVAATDPFELASLLAPLTATDIAGLSLGQGEVVVAATQRIINAVTTRQHAAIDACHGRLAERCEEERLAAQAEFDAAMSVHEAASDPRPSHDAAMGGHDAGIEADVGRSGARDGGDPEDREPDRRLRSRSPRVFFNEDPDRVCASWLAPLLHLAPRTMRTRVSRAVRLTQDLPRTFASSWDGDLEPSRIDAIITASAPVRASLLVEYDARVHHDDNLVDLATAAVKARAQRAALRTDPEGVVAWQSRAATGRYVRANPAEAPGMTRWDAELPTDTSQQMWAAIDSLATEFLTADAATGAPHTRTVAAARADALSALVLSNAQVETHVELVLPVVPTTPSATQTTAVAGPLTPAAPTTPAAQTTPAHLTTVTGPPIVPEPSSDHPSTPTTLTHPANAPWARWGDTVVDTMIRGEITPETASAPALEWDLAEVLQRPSEIWSNPRLQPGARGGAWFVPSAAVDCRLGVLLPDMLACLLANPDLQLHVTRLAGGADACDHAEASACTDDSGQVDTSRSAAAESGAALVVGVVSPTGVTTAERTYRPGAALARRVRRRDQHCRFPGCAIPATQCDLDHVVRYPDGPTAEHNLHALCRYHHLFKHHAGWILTMTLDGTCTWTAPTGRTHVTHPPDLLDPAA